MSRADLIFSAAVRCRCGAGMAHPKGIDSADHRCGGAWTCSDVLIGIVPPGPKHDAVRFGYLNILPETDGLLGGATTRERLVRQTVPEPMRWRDVARGK